MTRATIADGLQALILRLANNAETHTPPSGLDPREWAYIKGIASAAIMQLRTRMMMGDPPATVSWGDTREKAE